MTKRLRAQEVMHLAVVACGDRLDETLTMVKSALLFSLKRITFHIFAEDPLAPQFKEKVRKSPMACCPNVGQIIQMEPLNATFLVYFICILVQRVFGLVL